MGRFRTATAYAALAGVWATLWAPAAAAGERAGALPGDTFAYVEWRDVPAADGFWLRALRAVADAPLLKREAPDVAERLRELANLLAVVGQSGTAAYQPPIDPVDFDNVMEYRLQFDCKFDFQTEHANAVEALSTTLERLEVDLNDLEGAEIGSDGDHVTIRSRAAVEASPTGATLADNPRFLELRGVLGSPAGWHVDVYYDPAPLLRTVLDGMPPEGATTVRRMLTATGAEGFGPLLLRLEDTPHGLGYRGVATIPEADTGLGRLLRQTPLEERDLALLPRDARFGAVFTFDPAQLVAQVRDVAQACAPEVAQQIDAGLAFADGMIGISIEHDLLSAFGDTWALFDAPSHGGLLVTGACAVAEARDPDAINSFLRRCVQMAAPFALEGDVQLQVRTTELDGRTVHYLLVGGLPVPVTPAWAFADGYVVFALHPQVVAAGLRHVAAATRGPSILDHPAYARVRPDLPAQLTSFTYADPAGGAVAWNGFRLLVHTALASLTPDGEHAFDVADFPLFEPDAVKPYFAAGGIEDGRLVFTEMGISPALLLSGGSFSLAAVALSASILLPSLTRARGLAKRAVSASNLRSIGVAMHMWAQEHDERFASSFDELVQAAYITRDVLESPRQTDMSRAGYVLIPGQSASADPGNVLAYERIVDDEGTNVLFVDGHVEFMRPGEFERALRDTYERLGHPWQPPERE